MDSCDTHACTQDCDQMLKPKGNETACRGMVSLKENRCRKTLQVNTKTNQAPWEKHRNAVMHTRISLPHAQDSSPRTRLVHLIDIISN